MPPYISGPPLSLQIPGTATHAWIVVFLKFIFTSMHGHSAFARKYFVVGSKRYELALFNVTLNVMDILWDTGHEPRPQESLMDKLLHNTLKTTCSGESHVIDTVPARPPHSAASMWVWVFMWGVHMKFIESMEYYNEQSSYSMESVHLSPPMTLERKQRQVK